MTSDSSRPVAQPVAADWRAHKFGGSSLGTVERIRNAAGLVGRSTPQVVVVSAMQGVTDLLVELAARADLGLDCRDACQDLRARHTGSAAALAPHDTVLRERLDREFGALALELAQQATTRSADPRRAERIHGLGEVWSSRLLHATLGGDGAGWRCLDAREVLCVEQGELGVVVDWAASQERLAAWLSQSRCGAELRGVVVTGFVARDAQGVPTTLGRNGSDFSASIFARLFGAVELTIWTDVDGVLSADPRRVPDAVRLPRLSYAEACELAYFGARVLHPQTLAPAIEANIPIRIRSSLEPGSEGTWITGLLAHRDRDGRAESSASPPPPPAPSPPQAPLPLPEPSTSPVRGLSLAEGGAILELTGTGLIGVPGTAERLFAALRHAAISVSMISQGSSEHSICCVVRGEQAEQAKNVAQAAFAEAIADGQVQGVAITPDVAVLAAVGDGMVGTHGVAATLFAGLAQARVNIRAIAQGASERNISVAIAAADATRALRAAHSAFWLSPRTLSIGLIGPGNVGRELLWQIARAAPAFAREPRLDKRLELRLRAVANSRRMRLAERQLDPAQAVSLDDCPPLDLTAFAAHVRAEHLPHAVIIDCSGSDAVADHYARWLTSGIHVVTPSKHAGSGRLERYDAICDAARSGGHFRYEATVGAGLPVIQTLRNQLDTGDDLLGIEGILSGTLAWLLNGFDGSRPFSALLRQAHALGYTEPDPRDDLSGIDVARKLVILAREAGHRLSLDDVTVESLVPAALRSVDRETFMSRLEEFDAPLQARLDEARQQGGALRYIARLDEGGAARVGLCIPEPGDASLHGRLTDNLVQFRTRRYAVNPLVIQGPGAGPEVTAAGVFGDVLAIAQALGARL